MTGAIVEQARAKINLALHVLGRRDDGMHELDSIVAFADVGDVLHLRVAGATSLEVTGPFAGGLSSGDDNLVLRAHMQLAQHIDCPPVHFHLEKNLPVASGIGGGSADAAAALRGVLRLAGKTMAPQILTDIALALGADVPVCLQGQAVRMRGVGERLEAISALPGKAIVLVNPLKPCCNSLVFRALGLAHGQSFGSALAADQPGQWRNDLCQPAVAVVPEIANVLQALHAMDGFSTVRMSGSGATCFGLTDDLNHARGAAILLQKTHPQWWVAAAPLMQATASSS